MISRKALLQLGWPSWRLAVPAKAQDGPLSDPIPKPIPQSHIRVSLTPVASGLTAPDLHDHGQWRSDANVRRGSDGTDPASSRTDAPADAVPRHHGRDLPALTRLRPGPQRTESRLTTSEDCSGWRSTPVSATRPAPASSTLYTLHNVPITKAADFVEPPFPNANVVPNCQEVIAEWKVSAANPDAVDPEFVSRDPAVRQARVQSQRRHGCLRARRPPLRRLRRRRQRERRRRRPQPRNRECAGSHDDPRQDDPDQSAQSRLTTDQDGSLGSNGQYRIPTAQPVLHDARRAGGDLCLRVPQPVPLQLRGRRSAGWSSRDVGQNNIEEVDIVTSGGNFGWHLQEGTFLFDPTTGNVFTNPNPNPEPDQPVVEYDHFEATVNAVTRIADRRRLRLPRHPDPRPGGKFSRGPQRVPLRRRPADRQARAADPQRGDVHQGFRPGRRERAVCAGLAERRPERHQRGCPKNQPWGIEEAINVQAEWTGDNSDHLLRVQHCWTLRKGDTRDNVEIRTPISPNSL